MSENAGNTPRLRQAIFTSARSERFDGYHLVAHSAKIDRQDARALSAWSPSHDSLLENVPTAYSVNFFSLPSGAYCVSKTCVSGAEHSGRDGGRCYTHHLIGDAAALAVFDDHALRFFDWAQSQDLYVARASWPATLPEIPLASFECTDQRVPSDTASPDQMIHDPRIDILAEQLAGALDRPIGLVGVLDPFALTTAVLDRLPRQARLSCSFATGLRPSARRPFRLIFLPDDAQLQRRWTRQFRLALLDLGLCTVEEG